MAWGAIILNLPKGTKLEELPKDFQPPPIGNADDVYAALSVLFPEHEHQLGQTRYSDETCYVEFTYEKQGVVESIGVRSNAGQNAMAVMRAVCEAMKLTMVDYQSCQIANFDEATQENMEEYLAWSKRALDSD